MFDVSWAIAANIALQIQSGVVSTLVKNNTDLFSTAAS
jgi:hypothetical protein